MILNYIIYIYSIWSLNLNHAHFTWASFDSAGSDGRVSTTSGVLLVKRKSLKKRYLTAILFNVTNKEVCET